MDGELKQFRLMGDFLMEGGAALELATALLPRAFLPLACTANLAKNLAAVTASATRAPIYRTFAKRNNLGDVTAKGESVANLADVVGTVAGIVMARVGAPALPAFLVLSAGYLYASRREVDAVVLPFFNRARLALAAEAFAASAGRHCPSPVEAGTVEPMIFRPGSRASRVLVGAPAENAFGGSLLGLRAALRTLRTDAHALAYRPDRKTAYVLLRRDATTEDTLRGALCAHFLLSTLEDAHDADSLDDKTVNSLTLASKPGLFHRVARLRLKPHVVLQDPERAMKRLNIRVREEVKPISDPIAKADAALRLVEEESATLCAAFFASARAQGWDLAHTRLNPLDNRLELLHHAKPLL